MPDRSSPATLLAAITLAITGCAQGSPTSGTPLPAPPTGQPVALDQGRAEIELAVGGAVRLAGRDLIIGFAGVGGDSRCPSDATCVWQGDAEVELVLATDRGRERVALHTALDPRSIRRAGVVLELIAVSPLPRTDRRIPADAYRVTLRVREG